MMKPLTLEKIAEVTGGTYIGPPALAPALITGVVRDNREAEAGSLFVCFKGERSDGHDFVPAAFEAGAAACLCEREVPGAEGPIIVVDSTFAALKKLGAYYRSLFTLPVIGITGSVGKTTAKEMTAAVLGARFHVLKTEENLNNEIGVPLTLLKLRETHQAAVIEMGISDFGEMARLTEMVRPDICVMTNIGYSHLETLGDLNGVLRAKGEVFAGMRPDALAVVCGDDALLRDYDTGTRKITYGLGPDCDVRAENVETAGTGAVTFDIVHGDGRFPAVIPAYGEQLVLGALPAAAVGRALGLTDSEIARGLLRYAPVGGRACVLDTGYIRLIDDCYNANPNSMAAAVRSLAGLEGRRVAILGDMLELGRDTNDLHREIGVLAHESGLDCLICCGRKAEFIYKGLISTGSEMEAWHFPLKDALLDVLPSLIRRGDTVLVKASHGMHFEAFTKALKELR